MRDNSIQSIAMDFIKGRDDRAFEILMKRLRPGLLSFSYKYTRDTDICKEIVSKTFISIWEKIDQYNSEYKFSTWAYAIAKNEALGYLRGRNRTFSSDEMEQNHSKLLKAYTPLVTMDLEVIGTKKEEVIDVLYERTLEEIEKLGEPYRTVMIEREIKNKKLQDIAEDLGWNTSTVKTRLRKARKDISETLKKKYKHLVASYYERE